MVLPRPFVGRQSSEGRLWRQEPFFRAFPAGQVAFVVVLTLPPPLVCLPDVGLGDQIAHSLPDFLRLLEVVSRRDVTLEACILSRLCGIEPQCGSQTRGGIEAPRWGIPRRNLLSKHAEGRSLRDAQKSRTSKSRLDECCAWGELLFEITLVRHMSMCCTNFPNAM